MRKLPPRFPEWGCGICHGVWYTDGFLFGSHPEELEDEMDEDEDEGDSSSAAVPPPMPRIPERFLNGGK